MRVIAYIDGFNLYHGLKEQRWQHFYWLNISSLILKYLVEDQTLIYTKYFTSIVKSPPDKHARQHKYLQALSTLKEFEIYKGFFLDDEVSCNNCGHTYITYHEKKTDVNIAVELLSDAFDKKMDLALLVTADSDLVPAIVKAKLYDPGLKINLLFPPARTSKALVKVSDNHEWISRNRLAKSQFPFTIQKTDGYCITKPVEWTYGYKKT